MTTGLVQRFVQNQQQLAQSRGRRFRIKRPPRAQFPGAAERGYRAYLLGLVNAVKEDIDELLMPLIPQLVRVAGGRVDASRYNIEDIEGTLSTATEDISLRLNNQHLRGLEQKVGEYQTATSQRVNQDLRRQIRSMISLDAFPQAGTAERVQADTYLRQNVKLIESLTGRYVSQVEDMVRRGVQEGDRAQVIEDKVLSRWDVTRSRAKLIARDQVAKLRGNLTRIRQTSLGIDKYRWRTSRDERVRETHRAKEGKVYSWDKPPSDTGHPGQDYQCRCTAEPVIEKEKKLAAAVAPHIASAAIGTAIGFGLASGPTAAGAAAGTAGTVGAAAVVAAGPPRLPKEIWRFPGEPWVVSDATPLVKFDPKQLDRMIARADFTKDLTKSAQAEIRRELNAVLAAEGLMNVALERGAPGAASVKLEDLFEQGLAGTYSVETGELAVDRTVMQIMQATSKEGLPITDSPIFEALVHEVFHGASAASKASELTPLVRNIEEMSNEYFTQFVMWKQFGKRFRVFESGEHPYWKLAQSTRDAISDTLNAVDVGIKTKPSLKQIETSLGEFFLRWRRATTLPARRKSIDYLMENLFPREWFTGMSGQQVRAAREKLRDEFIYQWTKRGAPT